MGKISTFALPATSLLGALEAATYAKKGVNVTYNFQKLVDATFNNNVFYNIPAPSNSKIKVSGVITDDPQFKSVGALGNGLEAMAAKYALKASSSVLKKGIKIANNGGKDLLGNKASDNLMGAIEK